MVSQRIRSGRGRWAIACGLAAAGLSGGAGRVLAAPPPYYRIVGLGEGTVSATAINNSGQVAGTLAPSNPGQALRPFVWSNGTLTNIADEVYGRGEPVAINASGTVLLSSVMGQAAIYKYGYWSPVNVEEQSGFGQTTIVPVTYARRLNDDDVIGGSLVYTKNANSDYWSSTVPRDPFNPYPPPSTVYTSPLINNTRVLTSTGLAPLLWNSGSTFTYPSGISTYTFMNGLSSNNLVIGAHWLPGEGGVNPSFTDPFLWNAATGDVTSLNQPDAPVQITSVFGGSVNANGLVLASGAGGGVLWQDGTAVLLADRIVDGHGVSSLGANALNDSNQLVGSASGGIFGNGMAVLLEPVTRTAGQADGTWATDGGGSWGTATSGFGVNWGSGEGSPGVDAVFRSTDTATFGGAVTSGVATVTLDGANPSLREIVFDDALGGYVIAAGSGGRMTLDGGMGDAWGTVDVVQGTAEIAAVIENYDLDKIGSGTLVLSGSNTYTEGTRVSQGTLVAGNVHAFGSGAVTVKPGATLDLGGFTVTNRFTIEQGGTVTGANAPTGTISTDTTFTGTTFADVTIDGGTAVFEGAVNGSVTVAGSGSADLSGVIHATVDVSAGTATVSGAVTEQGALSVGSAGTVTFADGASYAGAGIANDGSIVVDTASSFLLAAGIGGNGGLVMAGPGVFELGGVNTFVGSTAVDLGTMLVNGALTSSDVTVGSDGTLGGSGSIGGDVMVDGTLSPGNSPGLLTIGSLTLGGASTTFMQITGATRGTQYDAVDVTGATVLGGSLMVDITASIPGDATFDLFHFGGGATGHFSAVSVAGIFGNLSFTRAGTVWSTATTGGGTLSFDESSGTFGIVAVPEGPTWALLVAGASVMAWRGLPACRRRADPA